MRVGDCACHDGCAGEHGIGNCTAAPSHSPTPWKIVRAEIPFYTWICDATGGCVAMGFGQRDEALLLAAPKLLAVCERALRMADLALVCDDLAAAVAAATKGVVQ